MNVLSNSTTAKVKITSYLFNVKGAVTKFIKIKTVVAATKRSET